MTRFFYFSTKKTDSYCDDDITFLALISKNYFLDAVKICQITIPRAVDDEEEEENTNRPGIDTLLKEKINLVKNSGITSFESDKRNIFAFQSTSRSTRVFG